MFYIYSLIYQISNIETKSHDRIVLNKIKCDSNNEHKPLYSSAIKKAIHAPIQKIIVIEKKRDAH